MQNTTENNHANYDAPPTDRAATNRANSKHSTGPRTESGKQRSSLNAMRHGLTGHTVVLKSDDLTVYFKRAQEFFDEYKPKGPTEIQLVQTLSDTAWRLNRIAALENNLLALGTAEQEDSIETSHPQATAALAMAKTYREQSHVINNLGTHETRLVRVFEKTLKQLRQIQSQRRDLEKVQLKNAALITELHAEEGYEYDPKDDGFVFSPAEIDTCIQRDYRLAQAILADQRRT